MDPEAFGVDYEEFVEACNLDQLQVMSEQDIIDRAWAEYHREVEGGHKFARVARVYVPLLREIFWHGVLKDKAQEVMRTLMLEQTQPFNALESAFGYFGDEEVMYMEVDSYTGEPLDMITEQQEAEAIGNRVAPKIPPIRDEVALSISEAYSSETMRSRALEASAINYTPLDLPEEDFYIDRGVTSEPIIQIIENDLRFEPGKMYDVRQATAPFIRAFNERRSEFFEMLKAKKYKFMKAEAKLAMWRAMCDFSDERRRFLECLQWLADDVHEPQYIGVQFLKLQNEDWGLKMSDAHEIELPLTNWKDLYEFIELFGDVILEQLNDDGSRYIPMSEVEIIETAERFEEEILEQYKESSENHKHAPQTRAFMRGVFSALERYDADLQTAGYATWREEKSKPGSYAYNRTYSIETMLGSKDAMKKAWRAFYKAGRIIALNRRGVKVKEELTGEVQQVSWNLAVWKLKRGEIYLEEGDHDRLRDTLEDHEIGHSLVAEL